MTILYDANMDIIYSGVVLIDGVLSHKIDRGYICTDIFNSAKNKLEVFDAKGDKVWEVDVKGFNTDKCTWSLSSDNYDTQCGNSFVFTSGDPSDNDFLFCPYCGKKLISGQENAN